MKYIMNRICAITLALLCLSSCEHHEALKSIGSPNINFQLKPNEPEDRVINDIVVSYDIPHGMIKSKSIDNILKFRKAPRGIKNRRERLIVTKNSPNLWIIERRTDNGVAGSGVIYDVEITQKKLPHATRVAFIVKRERKYQEGMTLPFAVPKFDIKQYLANAEIKYSFELNSPYDKESIQDNFKRLMTKRPSGDYIFQEKNTTYYSSLEFYNYRSGTKVVINSIIQNSNSDVDYIDVPQMIRNLENKMKEVINS